MASIKLKGDTSGEITISAPAVAGTTTLELPATSSTLATQNALGVRNLIINGDMKIAQRGTSFSASTSTFYLLDRFQYINVASPDSVYTITQDTDVPSGQGFAHSLKVDVATADATLDANDGTQIEHRIEAQNLQHLEYGTSDAKTMTLSFWVKSNKTGTYVVRLLQPDASSRMVSYAYTISLANTWEKKTITVSGDTSGVINNDNGAGLHITWWLSAGTDYQSGSMPTNWQAYANGDTAVGQVNLADSTSNYINITGIQLEVGTEATPFEHRPYDMELARCQRYFIKTDGVWKSDAVYVNGGRMSTTVQYPTTMRATPTVTFGTITTTSISAGPTAHRIRKDGFSIWANANGAGGDRNFTIADFSIDAEI